MPLEKTARLLETAGRRTSLFLNALGATALILLTLLTTADVAMRDLLNRPISGAYEISMFLMAILVACGIGYCASCNEHVKVELLVSALPRRSQAVVATISWLLSAVLIALMTWQCTLYSKTVFRDGTITPDLQIPIYPFIAMVALGSAVLCVVFLAQFFDALSRALKGNTQ